MSAALRRTVALSATALLLWVPAGAVAAPDLRGVSGPEALESVDLSGRWSFTPKGRAATTIEVPGGGWYKQGFTDVAEAGYERRIAVPDVAPDQVIQLVLPAVNHEAKLLVDGREVATNVTSFTPSVFDLTPHVRPGSEHTIRLDVKGREAMLGDARPASPTLPGVPTGAFGAGYTVPDAGSWSEAVPQGIFGPAPELRVLPAVHIADAFVRTSVAERTLAYDVWLANGSRTTRTVNLRGVLRGDAPYPEIPSQPVTVPAGETKRVTVGPLPWRAGPESYWWPNVPYRPGYRAQLHDLELDLAEDGLGLPPAHRCLSRRRFGIRLSRRLRSARVIVNGRRTPVRRRGGRLRATVDLRGLPRGRYTVRIAGVTKGGRRLRAERRYRTCAGWGRLARARAAAGPTTLHRARYRFGFREFRQVGTHYELNGVRANLRGDSLTGAIYDRIDHGGGKGDAFHTFPGFLPPSEASGGWPQAVDNVQRLNYNVVRIHQEPASPYMLDVADERGLMIIDETGVRGSESKQDFVAGRDNMLAHTRDLVVRDRHHASIVKWSQSNEPDANGRGEPPDFQRDLYRTIKANDATRPVSVDVTSKPYDEIAEPDFAAFQHYVNSDGSVGGYTDDPHVRDDRPFGRGEFIWPINNTRQGFTWFGTSVEKMREKDASDVRPYSLAGSFGNVIPGVRTTSYLADNDLPPLYGEDNLPDPWSNPQVRRVQQGFHPVLVADRDYWEEQKLSDPAGRWPAKPVVLRAGQPVKRSLVVFNDTFAGERVDVRWELGEQRGAFAVDVPLGGRVVREIEITPQAPGQVALVVVAEKDGREVFRETEQVFEVLP